MPVTARRAVFAALFLILAAWSASELRLGAMVRQPLLPTRFDHGDHRGVACITCHHNFRDRGLGAGGCLRCHKAWGTTEARRIDVMFHAFCTGCHRQRQTAGEASGPVKGCAACHVRR